MKRKQTSLTLLAALLCILLVITPTVCAVIYFVRNVSQQLEDTASASADFYLEQLSGNVESTMDAVRNCIFLLTTNDRVATLMTSAQPLGTAEKQPLEDEIGQILLHSSAWDSTGLQGVYLYKNDGTYFTMLREGIYSGTARRIATVYERAQYLNSARDLITFEDMPGYAYCVTDYIDIGLMRPIGKIIFEIRFGRLGGTSYITTLYPGAAVFLSSENGALYYSSRGSEDSNSKAFFPLLAAGSGANSDFLRVDGIPYYHARRTLTDYDIKVDAFLPRSEIFKTVDSTVQFYLTYSVIVLLITLSLGAFAYTVMANPLHRMISKMYLLAQGDLSVRMDPTPYRETDQIVTAFNKMGDELESLFGEVYQQGLLLREAEFDLLESQISPHFIFNVLESINMRAAQAGQGDVCRMVTSLAELLRANILNRGHQKITFRQELDYVTYYLGLQKMRFEDKLRFHIDLEDDDILKCYLPKLTIQPLVENAVVHGIENKREGGRVTVSIWEEDCLYIRVQDDGVGFDATAPQTDSRPGNHVALDNIRRRIELLYDSEYGVDIKSTPGEGTIVTVRLPRDEKGEFIC